MKYPNRPTLLAVGISAVSLATTAFARPASPNQTFIVNTTADTLDANPGDGICADANGNCSLRAAIQEANARPAVVTHIRLQSNQTYSLTRVGADEDGALFGDLDIVGKISIAGRSSTIDALGADRAFHVISPGRARINDLDVRNGSVTDDSGGAFRTEDVLHLTRVTISNSTALGVGASGGAIFNDGGEFSMTGCTVTGGRASRAGGAIEANAGTTTIALSTIDSNTAGPSPGNGGGFHLTGAGIVSVSDCSFSGNWADREGGALWNSDSGEMTIANTQILDNRAVGTASDDGGGGLFNDGGSMAVTRSILQGNEAVMGAGSGGGVFNNGGLVTITLSRLRANISSRAGGGVEALAGSTTLVNCELSGNMTGPSPGNGGGLHLTGAGLVTVEGTDVLDNRASAEGGGLWNSVSGTMDIANSLVRGNIASGDAPDEGGGGLFNDGGLMSVSGSTVAFNYADGASGSGGGALNNAGNLLASSTRFQNNAAERAGGAIEANGGTTDLDNVVMMWNECGPAPGNGGALHLTGAGDVTIDDSVASSNNASAEGGALWNSSSGTMTITHCDIDGNTASGDNSDQGGGGVFNDGGTMTIVGGVISNNAADGTSGSGGGVLNNLGTLEITGTTISGNSSRRAGGGVEANIGTTTLKQVRLESNSTGPMPGNGGGLHLTGAGLVLVDESSVTRNSAQNEGGGLWNSQTGTMTVTSTRIDDNTSPIGADVFNDGGTFTIDGVDVKPGP